MNDAGAASREQAIRLLGAGRYRTLEILARALLPPGGGVAPGADEAEVAAEVARLTALLPPGARAGLRLALGAWDLGAAPRTRGRRFGRLSEGEAAAYTEAAAVGGGWRRALLTALKGLCVAAYAGHPCVAGELGFDDSCGEGAVGPERRLSPIAYPEIRGDVRVRVDAVVVGSGAGGAVVAKELAERGLSVAVVEEGAHFTRRDFRGPLLDRVLRFYRAGGLTAALGRPIIPVPMGKAVGGTTVVNSGTCFRTPDAVLRAWESERGLEGVAPEAMAPIFERVERILHVRPVPEDVLGENARVFRRGVEALGLHGEPIRRNIEGCHGCGVCPFGCPSDAKRAMHLSYLPLAEAAGARIYARCRVRRILRRAGRAAGVEAEILGEEGAAGGRDERVEGRLRVAADVVVLAAGAVYTPLLLMGEGLSGRAGPVGRGLRIHPAVAVAGVFDEDVYGWRGTLQSFFADDLQASHGVLFEVTSPLPGVFAAKGPAVGRALKDALGEARRIASVGLFVADSSSGRVRRLPGGRPLLSYRLSRRDTSGLVTGISLAARTLFAAGARRVDCGIAGLPLLRDPSELSRLAERAWPPSALTVMGFHPCATAPMGRDRERAAVDPWGESFALPGLYVADAAALPDCAGVNPQVTIMAMATRIAWRLAERLGARRSVAP